MMHRRQGKKTQPSHADDWLMTYADMITLLLCFFAIFLVISTSKKNIPQNKQVQPIAETMQQPAQSVQPLAITPDTFPNNLLFHEIGPADYPVEVAAVQTLAKIDKSKPQEQTLPLPSDVSTLRTDVAPTPTPTPTPTPVAAPPISVPEIVNSLKAQGPANFEKGDRITTFEVSSAAFFDSGSATLSDAGKLILRDVTTNLKSDQFKGYRITVEGHTDDMPIHTALFPSNWELSTARASAVVHFFLDQGIPAQRLRAAGYADTFPEVPNDDVTGNPIPANQTRNRRVVIKLEKIEKNETPGMANSVTERLSPVP